MILIGIFTVLFLSTKLHADGLIIPAAVLGALGEGLSGLTGGLDALTTAPSGHGDSGVTPAGIAYGKPRLTRNLKPPVGSYCPSPRKIEPYIPYKQPLNPDSKKRYSEEEVLILEEKVIPQNPVIIEEKIVPHSPLIIKQKPVIKPTVILEVEPEPAEEVILEEKHVLHKEQFVYKPVPYTSFVKEEEKEIILEDNPDSYETWEPVPKGNIYAPRVTNPYWSGVINPGGPLIPTGLKSQCVKVSSLLVVPRHLCSAGGEDLLCTLHCTLSGHTKGGICRVHQNDCCCED